MISVDNIETFGWMAAVRGMRNPMNSWEKSDTYRSSDDGSYCPVIVGDNDIKLMQALFKAGTEERKFLRMIHVQMDILAPMYWWKEFDTYKVGVTRNSCSTMHKITSKEFTIDDFSYDMLTLDKDVMAGVYIIGSKGVCLYTPMSVLKNCTIPMLNALRAKYLETKDKRYEYQMFQILPESYNVRATIDMNYENVFTIIHQRENHKLNEWRYFCETLKSLPYVKEIGGSWRSFHDV